MDKCGKVPVDSGFWPAQPAAGGGGRAGAKGQGKAVPREQFLIFFYFYFFV